MIEILKPGLFSTIQDKGRVGLQSYGIPHSGSMDSFSSDLGNKILGNNVENAVMEITMIGPVLEFKTSSIICITGADLSPFINNVNVLMNTSLVVRKNDVLSFGRLIDGLRSYIAISGGFKTEKAYNSRSMCKNVTKAVRLNKNDILKFDKSVTLSDSELLVKNIKSFGNVLSVYKGPEFFMLNSYQQNYIMSHEFSISNSYNRMAVQLKDLIVNELVSIITSPVIPGTVQLTPNGTLIILMRDCQTTGGYPRILQLEEKSINSVSQLKKKSKLNFKLKI